jgi:methyl-accepting chemotaxis protein
MNESSESSSSKIKSVMDEIAFQNNLLALSAAVESSRAVQAVAREIRKLSQHSAPAADGPALDQDGRAAAG